MPQRLPFLEDAQGLMNMALENLQKPLANAFS